MKRVRAISIVVVIGLLVGQASGALTVSFEPSSQTVGLGSSVDVAIRMSGLGNLMAPSLGTFDLDIAYDPAIVSFSSAT